MGKVKLAITLDEDLFREMDLLVKEKIFPSRSRMIGEALREKLERVRMEKLAEECAKLDPDFEKAMAEEGISGEVEGWPEY
ncbi:MAG: CopG family transcriptional regulator [Aquificota bacterium]|nr:MAG: CopG family transcriptional regulator [Aquificota bacterium]RLD97194.1 MAG: CopG family transcriptional regulator [Aquificota bacterium]